MISENDHPTLADWMLNAAAADLLANGGRNRPLCDRQLSGPGYLASANGLDVFQAQQSGVMARGMTPVPGAGLQRGPSSPLAADVSLDSRGQSHVFYLAVWL